MGQVKLHHNFYVFDKLPYEVILGMNFIDEYGVILDVTTGTLTIPKYRASLQINFISELTPKLPLFTEQLLVLPPASTQQVTLRLQKSGRDDGVEVVESMQGEVSSGVSEAYSDSVIVWKGVITKSDQDSVDVWYQTFHVMRSFWILARC